MLLVAYALDFIFLTWPLDFSTILMSIPTVVEFSNRTLNNDRNQNVGSKKIYPFFSPYWLVFLINFYSYYRRQYGKCIMWRNVSYWRSCFGNRWSLVWWFLELWQYKPVGLSTGLYCATQACVSRTECFHQLIIIYYRFNCSHALS